MVFGPLCNHIAAEKATRGALWANQRALDVTEAVWLLRLPPDVSFVALGPLHTAKMHFGYPRHDQGLLAVSLGWPSDHILHQLLQYSNRNVRRNIE